MVVGPTIFHHDGGRTTTQQTLKKPVREPTTYLASLPDPDSNSSINREQHWIGGKPLSSPSRWSDLGCEGSGEREVDNGPEDNFRGSPNGNGNPLLADDDADDREVVIENDAGVRLDSYPDIDVRRVYT